MLRNYLPTIIGVLTLCMSIQNTEAADTKSVAIHDTEKATQVNNNNTLQKAKYRIGVSYVNGFPMFGLADTEDRGFGWSILELFAQANNIEFEYIVMPITRLQPSMDSGAIDFIFPDNPNWSSYRSNRIPNIYSGEVFSAISASFVRSENQTIMLDEVKTVAIPFGYTANTWFDPIQIYNIKSMPVRDLNTALYSIAQGTADAADVEYNIAQHLISQNSSLNGIVLNPSLPSRNVEYHVSSIKHIIVLEKLTAFIEKEKGSIALLRKHYSIKSYDEVFGEDQKHIQ